jgi:hypothetical protein
VNEVWQFAQTEEAFVATNKRIDELIQRVIALEGKVKKLSGTVEILDSTKGVNYLD